VSTPNDQIALEKALNEQRDSLPKSTAAESLENKAEEKPEK
jgi:hypothetical protein